MNVFYIVVGMAAGGLLGASMAIFNRFKANNWIKFALMLVIAVLNPIFCNSVGFEESKYIGIITYGFSHSELGELTNLTKNSPNFGSSASPFCLEPSEHPFNSTILTAA